MVGCGRSFINNRSVGRFYFYKVILVCKMYGVGLLSLIRTEAKCLPAVKDAIGGFYWHNWGCY